MSHPYVDDPDFKLYVGDVTSVLGALPNKHVHCIVTSPPYWGLRDYGMEGQIGLEETPQEYVAKMVAVFAEARRVLRDDGTLWLNLGDTYASNWGLGAKRESSWWSTGSGDQEGKGWGEVQTALPPNQFKPSGKGLKVKDLCGIPWRTAFALQDDGWYLRRDIIWSKPNPMPESVRDRCTTSHEYLFMFTKKQKYYYDADSIREPYHYDGRKVTTVVGKDGSIQHRNGERWPGIGKASHAARADTTQHGHDESEPMEIGVGRNKRSVWEVAAEPYPEAHFATYPQALIEPCVKAGSPVGGVVLDPFSGSGTTALVCRRLQRNSIGIELNPEYAELAARRLAQLSLLA